MYLLRLDTLVLETVSSFVVDFEKGADNTRIERKRDIERWAKDVYSFVCGRYGEQNIAAFIVHLDELNPHIHCTLLPIKARLTDSDCSPAGGAPSW